MAFPKNAKKYNNNVAFPKGRLWRAHCVHLEIGRKGLKPLVIRNKDAKNINNNAAFPKGRLWRAHCVHLQIGCKSKTDLLSTSINSDNLSRSNPCFVINNFIHKEDILMKDIKKFLIAALSFMLLVSISCSNDNKTGSTTDGGVDGTLPDSYKQESFYRSNTELGEDPDKSYWWLIFKDGKIYMTVETQPNQKPTDYETTSDTTLGPNFKVSGNTYTCNDDSGLTYKFELTSETALKMEVLQDGQVGMSGDFTKQQ